MTDATSAADAKLRRVYRVRIIAFLAAVVVFLTALNALTKAVNTVQELNAVEADRDGWQRPDQVLSALGKVTGCAVADIGSGAGYFTLKLSGQVGSSGQVIAEDIQRLPLLFLWIRARLRGEDNVHVRLGSADDPRLTHSSLDAVLIVNTYHEFEHPQLILSRIKRALRPHGRMVVLDRNAGREGGHGLPPELVDRQLRDAGFEITESDDGFIVRPDSEQWWLIVARKAAK